MDFTLTKAKLNKEGGIDANYSMSGTRNSVKSAEYPHKYLTDLFRELKPMIARVFNIESMQDFFKVSGICLAGKDENKGCVILADYVTVGAQMVPVRTPRIKFAENYYGFEPKLQEIAEKIEEETYKYLFEGKVGELEEFEL